MCTCFFCLNTSPVNTGSCDTWFKEQVVFTCQTGFFFPSVSWLIYIYIVSCIIQHKECKGKGWEMPSQLVAVGSCHSPQGRWGSEMLFAEGQRGFADRRGMVRLRQICCKWLSQLCLSFLLSLSFWTPFNSHLAGFCCTCSHFPLHHFSLSINPVSPGRLGFPLPHSRQQLHIAGSASLTSCSPVLPSLSSSPLLLPVSSPGSDWEIWFS